MNCDVDGESSVLVDVRLVVEMHSFSVAVDSAVGVCCLYGGRILPVAGASWRKALAHLGGLCDIEGDCV